MDLGTGDSEVGEEQDGDGLSSMKSTKMFVEKKCMFYLHNSK